MHTLVEVNSTNTQGTHVPAFLAKLWKLVDDQNTNNLIYWSEMGNSFIIRNQAKFARDLLPLYYKHNNMASFVRQLNMYGFHKVVSVEQGGLKVDKDEMEFAHPFFLRGQESSLELIKRKIPAAKHDDSRVRPDSLQKVLMDVRHMKGKQENIDTKLITMKRENEALWRELASLRQKHAKQTQIVSKLLQFLVGMMSTQTHRLGFKRRFPLMLSDADGQKDRKHSRNNEGQNLSGPLIRDVTEIFEADSGDEQDHSDYLTGSSGSDGDNHPKVDSPKSVSAKSPYSESILGLDLDSSDDLLSVDPCNVTPAERILARLHSGIKAHDDRIKVKHNEKNSNKQVNAVSQSRPQIPQTSSSTTQANLPPLSSLYTGEQEVTEPDQFVLSIPELPRVQTTDIGVNTDSAISTASSTLISQPIESILEEVQKTLATNTDMVPTSDGVIEIPRNQNNAISSQFLVKPQGTDDLDGHLDDMQVGLDNLKDILKSEDYKMDHSTLLGLFGGDDRGIYDLNNHMQGIEAADAMEGVSSLSGQELVSYNPSLFELTEDDSQFFDDSSNIFLDDELESMLTTDRNRLSKTQRGSSTSFASALSGQLNETSTAEVTNSGTESALGNESPLKITPQGRSIVAAGNVSGAAKRKRK